jgi:hypothetical protein
VRDAKDQPKTVELGGYMITAAIACWRGGPGGVLAGLRAMAADMRPFAWIITYIRSLR